MSLVEYRRKRRFDQTKEPRDRSGLPDGWIGRSRASRRVRRTKRSRAGFARDVLPAARNAPERNTSYAADLFPALLDLSFCLFSACADLRQRCFSVRDWLELGSRVGAG